MASQELPHSILYGAGMYLSAATFLGGIAWGIMTSFYAVCTYTLIHKLRSTKVSWKIAMMTIWITILWISASLSTLGNAIALINAFVWEMYYPGGPEAYLDVIWNQPLPVLTVTTFLLTMWFADAMMLWRLVVFNYGLNRFTRGLIISFAFLLYIGTLGTGCAMLVIIHLNQTLWSTYAQKVSIPCFTLSMVLNVFVTAFISIRLLSFKRKMERTLGRKEAQASPYTSVVAMLIESAALYAIWALVFIVVYLLNSPGQYVVVVVLCDVQVISPSMIVYRVSKGVGWEKSTSAKLTVMSQIAFAEGQGELNAAFEPRDREEQPKDKASSDMVFVLPVESAP